MKKTKTLWGSFGLVGLTALAILLFVPTRRALAFSGAGAGTNGDPYIITGAGACSELQEMNDDLAAHYELASDVDCAGSGSWNGNQGFVPIGDDAGTKFTGSLNGNDHIIKDLVINNSSRGSSGTGLFGSVGTTGYVGHVGMQYGQITAGDRSGVLVGYNHGTIEYSFTNVPANLGGFSGGFVGLNYAGTITNSYARGDVTSNSTYVGGFAGFNNSTISDSYSTGNIIGGGLVVGGFVGRLWTGTVQNVFSTGSVGGSNNAGLIGESNGGTITNANWDSILSGQAHCWTDYTDSNMPSDVGCTDRSSNADYFKSLANQPFSLFTNPNSFLQTYAHETPTFSWHTLLAPDTPTGFSAEKIDSATLATHWTAPHHNGGSQLTGYTVQYKLSSDSNWSSTSGQAGAPSFNIDLSLFTAGAQYDFRAIATNAIGDSEASNSIHYTIPNPDIHTCADLQAIATSPASNYTLAQNIDCTETQTWNDNGSGGFYGFVPITNFTGTFDGHGHTIDGLYINRPGDSGQALFSNVSGEALISNVTLTNLDVTGYSDVGGVVGDMYPAATIDNVHTHGSISGSYSAGGIVGYLESDGVGDMNISNSTSDVQISQSNGNGTNSWGGIVGYAYIYGDTVSITDSSTSMNVEVDGSYVGGLVGYVENYEGGVLNITGSSSNGNIGNSNCTGGLVGYIYQSLNDPGDRPQINISSSNSSAHVYGSDYLGGFVGEVESYNGDMNIDGSYYVGSISGDNDYLGGFVGGEYDEGTGSTLTVTKSYTGGSYSSGGSHIGGMVGYTDYSAAITDSYSDIDISGTQYLGGLVGNGHADITQSYASGTINGTSVMGGLVGDMADGSITDSFGAVSITSSINIMTTLGGLVGSIYNGVITNSYVDHTVNTQGCITTYSIGGEPSIDCTVISDNGYFFNNHTNAPFDAPWDFTDTWITRSADYPILQIGVPQIECEASSRTDTTLSVACDYFPKHWGDTTWEMQYQAFGATSWTDVTLDDPSIAIATIVGVDANTAYRVRFRFTNDYGTSEWGRIDYFSLHDSDQDGTIDSQETAGPKGGDANGDNILDVNQSNVSSWLNPITNKYVVLETSGCDTNGAHSNSANLYTNVAAASQDHKDVAYVYPAGVMSYSADCGQSFCYSCEQSAVFAIHPLCCPAPGNFVPGLWTLTVSQYFYGDYDASKVVARKYNSQTHSYANIPGAVITNVVIGGQKAVKISYQIADNGPLDEDPAIGVITDPSGPAQLAVDAPNTGLGGKSD